VAAAYAVEHFVKLAMRANKVQVKLYEHNVVVVDVVVAEVVVVIVAACRSKTIVATLGLFSLKLLCFLAVFTLTLFY